MIISVSDIVNVYGLMKNKDENYIKLELEGIESLIRLYTNNNFQNRKVRLNCPSKDNYLLGFNPHLKVGDTVQITSSNYNDGLYVIEEISNNQIKLDKNIYDVDIQTVTKVEYPPAVLLTLVNLLKWEETNGSKTGIQSESIGRHSVTYFAQNEQNSLGGYPLNLFNPLNQFKMASRRFL